MPRVAHGGVGLWGGDTLSLENIRAKEWRPVAPSSPSFLSIFEKTFTEF